MQRKATSIKNTAETAERERERERLNITYFLEHPQLSNTGKSSAPIILARVSKNVPKCFNLVTWPQISTYNVFAKFQGLTAVNVKIRVFWGTKGGVGCLQLLGRRVMGLTVSS